MSGVLKCQDGHVCYFYTENELEFVGFGQSCKWTGIPLMRILLMIDFLENYPPRNEGTRGLVHLIEGENCNGGR